MQHQCHPHLQLLLVLRLMSLIATSLPSLKLCQPGSSSCLQLLNVSLALYDNFQGMPQLYFGSASDFPCAGVQQACV